MTERHKQLLERLAGEVATLVAQSFVDKGCVAFERDWRLDGRNTLTIRYHDDNDPDVEFWRQRPAPSVAYELMRRPMMERAVRRALTPIGDVLAPLI